MNITQFGATEKYQDVFSAFQKGAVFVTPFMIYIVGAYLPTL